MPDSKISALPSGIPAQAGDQFPIARSGLNYSLTPVTLASAFTNLGAWQAVQTSSFTAAVGKAYPINTTSAAITVTLPSSATFGDVIYLADYAGTFATNNLTIDPNYSTKLNNSLSPGVVSTNRAALQLVYSGLPQGWLCYTDTIANLFSSLFTVNGVVIAGGGGTGRTHSGGGGAGGYRIYSVIYPPSPSPGTLETGTVTVGAGGTAGTGSPGPTGAPSNGSPSVLNTITSAGGGFAGNASGVGQQPGNPGGSGGGGNYYFGGGTGNTPATTPAQGTPGSPSYAANGAPGGGATVSGSGGSFGAYNPILGISFSTTSVTIGTGSKTFTTGTGLSYAANEPIRIYYDSSNFMYASVTSYTSGTGVLVVDVGAVSGSGTYASWTIGRSYAGGGKGTSGGGAVDGGGGATTPATPGAANTGGGAGANTLTSGSGAAGGSGVVIISVPNTASVTFSGGVTSTMTTVGTNKVYKVTATSTTSETYTVTVP